MIAKVFINLNDKYVSMGIRRGRSTVGDIYCTEYTDLCHELRSYVEHYKIRKAQVFFVLKERDVMIRIVNYPSMGSRSSLHTYIENDKYKVFPMDINKYEVEYSIINNNSMYSVMFMGLPKDIFEKYFYMIINVGLVPVHFDIYESGLCMYFAKRFRRKVILIAHQNMDKVYFSLIKKGVCLAIRHAPMKCEQSLTELKRLFGYYTDVDVSEVEEVFMMGKEFDVLEKLFKRDRLTVCNDEDRLLFESAEVRDNVFKTHKFFIR